MESARGESCPSGQRRGPVPPGDDEFPSPDQKSIQTTHKPGDENGDPPVRYRPARCGNLNPIGWLLIGWGSWSQRAARVALRADVDVLPHPGRIGSHPRIKNPSKSLQFQTQGRKRRSPASIPPRTVWKPQPQWLVADWLGLMAPAWVESCPSSQRRDPAEPGEDLVSSSD